MTWLVCHGQFLTRAKQCFLNLKIKIFFFKNCFFTRYSFLKLPFLPALQSLLTHVFTEWLLLMNTIFVDIIIAPNKDGCWSSGNLHRKNRNVRNRSTTDLSNFRKISILLVETSYSSDKTHLKHAKLSPIPIKFMYSQKPGSLP